MVDYQIESDIWLALKAQVDAIATAGLIAASAIAWPNKTFTRPSSGSYLDVIHRPNVPEPMSTPNDGKNYYQGVLLLNLYAQLNHASGGGNAGELAAKIAAYFPKGQIMEYGDAVIRVQRKPSVQGGFPSQDGTRWQVPIQIRYHGEL